MFYSSLKWDSNDKQIIIHIYIFRSDWAERFASATSKKPTKKSIIVWKSAKSAGNKKVRRISGSGGGDDDNDDDFACFGGKPWIIVMSNCDDNSEADDNLSDLRWNWQGFFPSWFQWDVRDLMKKIRNSYLMNHGRKLYHEKKSY